MAAEPPVEFTVAALADGLKIAAPTSETVYYKIVLPITLGYNVGVEIMISPPCMESGNLLNISDVCDVVGGANAITFAYDTSSVRVVAWSVE